MSRYLKIYTSSIKPLIASKSPFHAAFRGADAYIAGLFVKIHRDDIYKKVIADDPEVILFQVGEFSQLASNDGIRAIKHRVQKAECSIERYGGP